MIAGFCETRARDQSHVSRAENRYSHGMLNPRKGSEVYTIAARATAARSRPAGFELGDAFHGVVAPRELGAARERGLQSLESLRAVARLGERDAPVIANLGLAGERRGRLCEQRQTHRG